MRAKILTIVAIFLLPSFAQATCEQHGNTLGKIGVNGNQVFAEITDVTSTRDCGCRTVLFSQDVTDASMAMSILLTAKMVDKKVRIDFADGPKCDVGTRVYVH